MATATLTDYTVTTTWTDVIATLAAAASVDALYQNTGSGPVRIVFGGASAPASTVTGLILGAQDSVQGNAAKVWVRAADGGTLSVATI